MQRVADPASRPFLDTNVLLYLLSSDTVKADRAEVLLAAGATIGVQVLNEFVNVASRKLAMPLGQIVEVLSLIRSRCRVLDLSVAVHDRAITLAGRHGFAWYDALIVAAAVEAGCKTLFSEDMHDGLKVDGSLLTIRNPFAIRSRSIAIERPHVQFPPPAPHDALRPRLRAHRRARRRQPAVHHAVGAHPA